MHSIHGNTKPTSDRGRGRKRKRENGGFERNNRPRVENWDPTVTTATIVPLRNPNNACFMNAAVQCAVRLRSFANDVLHPTEQAHRLQSLGPIVRGSCGLEHQKHSDHALLIRETTTSVPSRKRRGSSTSELAHNTTVTKRWGICSTTAPTPPSTRHSKCLKTRCSTSMVQKFWIADKYFVKFN